MKQRKKKTSNVVFLFDIDNTLLNNDQVTRDLQEHLKFCVGEKGASAYWKFFEERREYLGYADYLGALQRYRDKYPHEWQLLNISEFLIEYPFANRLFPNSLDAIEHAKKLGTVSLLSDGDVVFQPRKAVRSGLSHAVEGNVLIYTHKEQELSDVIKHFPARHYVMVDDKIRILTAMKKIWGKKLTTIFVRQGHYALDEKLVAQYPPADISIERIGEFMDLTPARLLLRQK